MANQINLQPQVLNLMLYSGDGVKIRLLCKNSADAPIDVTGTVKAQVREKPLDPDPAIVEFASNMVDSYQGIVVLSLTGNQTKTLSQHPSNNNGKFTGVWDVQWIAANEEPRTLCQGSVECVSDVTR